MAKANPTQITQWKKHNTDVFEIEVAITETEKAYYYAKKPSFAIVLLAEKAIEKDEMETAVSILYNNCLIYADKEIENNEEAKIGVYTKLATLFEIKQATIKKL